MSHEEWMTEAAREPHRHGVRGEPVGRVVAEPAGRPRQGGEPPTAVSGPAGEFAAAVVDGQPAVARRATVSGSGEVRLEAVGIRKRYGRRTVLSDVDLTVHAGEVVAITGANGCGKSTFLRICAGLVRPDRGRVRVYGSMGYSPQKGGTCAFLSPDEHFVLVGAGRGLSRTAALRTGHQRAAILDWDPTGRRPARHLSGGTQQKLNVVLADLGEPDLLLLDEPYQGFDHGAYVDFWKQVWRWRAHGKAIVVVTHLLNQLDRVDAVVDLSPTGGNKV